MKRFPQTITQRLAQRTADIALATWITIAILGAIAFAVSYGLLEVFFEGPRAKPALKTAAR